MLIKNSKELVAAFILFVCCWQIAQAQEQPVINSTDSPSKLLELGKTSDREFSTKVDLMLDSLGHDFQDSKVSGTALLVYLYGDEIEMARQKKLLLKSLEGKSLYHTWVEFVEGKTCKRTTTIFWRLPHGVKFPEVCEGDEHRKPDQ